MLPFATASWVSRCSLTEPSCAEGQHGLSLTTLLEENGGALRICACLRSLGLNLFQVKDEMAEVKDRAGFSKLTLPFRPAEYPSDGADWG